MSNDPIAKGRTETDEVAETCIPRWAPHTFACSHPLARWGRRVLDPVKPDANNHEAYA